MKNVSNLRTELSKVFDQLKKNELDIQQAKAIVATSNAMLKSAQLEMEHSKMTGSAKSITFLSTDD
tara:strand:+ start:424 stop:621 length:198 start_codon:yes stop_codon:yes gene_type:complete